MRNPFDVANSLVKKGCYKAKYFKKIKNKLLDTKEYQHIFIINIIIFANQAQKVIHFYSWNKLDPLLKVKWYWDTISTEIFKDLNQDSTKIL